MSDKKKDDKPKKVTCSACGGSGKIELLDSKLNTHWATCPYCRGTGEINA